MPVTTSDLSAGTFHNVTLNVTATQGTSNKAQPSITLQPPPLLLVHGVWSSAAQAWGGANGFQQWLGSNYPTNLIEPVDYGDISSEAFSNPAIQSRFLSTLTSALYGAANQGVASRSVDVVGHSMGGLLTRSFLDNTSDQAPYFPAAPFLPSNPVHKLITIGTPHNGSPLAVTLFNNESKSAVIVPPPFFVLCHLFSTCTLADLMGALGKNVRGGAVQSLEEGISSAPKNYTFNSIVGAAPTYSLTETALNALINIFLPGDTVNGILGGPDNDTIVPASSQVPLPLNLNTATIDGIVHTSLCQGWSLSGVSLCPDTGETASQAVWCQALYWLMGGTGPIPSGEMQSCNPSTGSTSSTSSAAATKLDQLQQTSSTSPPVLDLTGYTQVAASNVAFSPATNSTLTINAPATITATSSTKTITEVLLFQQVSDPTDIPMIYSTQSPFSIGFTPTRMGMAVFAATVVFSDMTYATETVQYTLQPTGTQADLTLVNPPAGNLPLGSSMVIHAQAGFPTGAVDATQLATYTVRSGTSLVFKVGAGGIITTAGTGVDWLDVSYGGFSASAPITVGTCTYSLSPTNQIVDYSGGAVSIQVATADGCAWTADDGGATWLKADDTHGSGNGTITLTASANTTGATQVAFVSVANQNVAITQPATACTYDVSVAPISVPAIGVTDNLAATSPCPILASSDATWLTVVSLGGGSGVLYIAAANPDASPRTATMTVGTKSVTVTQAAGSPAQANPAPSALSFSNQNLGVSTASSAVKITNPGTGSLSFSGITFAGTDSADFAVAPTGTTCSTYFQLAGATSCTINVTFTPSATGSRTASLKITDNASSSPQTVSLKGTGLPAVGVALSPASKSLALGATQVFTATISNATNTALKWYVNGVLKGNSTQGTLTGCTTAAPLTCTYKAPAVDVPSPNPAVIEVASAEDPTKTKTADVTVTDTIAVTLSPTSKSLEHSATQLFTATIGNTTNTALDWYVNGVLNGSAAQGLLTGTGLTRTYTAPPAVEPSPNPAVIKVASVADPTKFMTADVTVAAAIAVTLSPSTKSLATGATQVFTATISNTTNTALEWSVNGVLNGNSTEGTLTGTGLTRAYKAPAALPSPNPAVIKVASVADTSIYKTASVTVANPIAVTFSPASPSVPLGGTQVFTATITGTTNAALDWYVNGVLDGNATQGTLTACSTAAPWTCTYTAPPVDMPRTNPVVIKVVSVADTSIYKTASVTVTTSIVVGLTPTTASVALGGTQLFTATISNTTDNRLGWSVNGVPNGSATQGTLTGCKLVAPQSCIYTAPTAATPGPNPAVIEVQSYADPSKSATASVTVTTP
jgi:pimeloyl-ACP methyl ester carboxylesterase